MPSIAALDQFVVVGLLCVVVADFVEHVGEQRDAAVALAAAAWSALSDAPASATPATIPTAR